MVEKYVFELLNVDHENILTFKDLSWEQIKVVCNLADELGYTMKVYPFFVED